MGTLGVDSVDWEKIGKNYSELVPTRKGLKNIVTFDKDVWGDLSKYTIDWTAFQQNVTSSYNEISNLNNYLSSCNDNKLSVYNLALVPLNNLTKDFKTNLQTIVSILDTLAGTNSSSTAADNLLASVSGLCNALTACIAPVTEIGFPDIPLIGNLGNILKALAQKDAVIKQLPEDIQKAVRERIKKEKEDNPVAWGDHIMQYIKDTGIWPLILEGWQDIIKIISTLPMLPITILFAAISVLIDAVSQLFKVVGLGAFNFDSLIKGKGLNFNLNVTDPGFSFDPPGNILEALAKCIPLIFQTIMNLPQMLINGLMENIWLIFGGFKSIANGAAFTNQDFMISAIHDTQLSNELFIENEGYKKEISDYEDKRSEKQNELARLTIGGLESDDKKIGNLQTEIKKISSEIASLEDKIESNEQKMKDLTKFNVKT